MKRTLLGFTYQDIQALDALSEVKQVSRAELIRQAVSPVPGEIPACRALRCGVWGLEVQKNG